MNKGDIVHGIVPEFSNYNHYFIVVYSKIKNFTLLPITSKEGEWDIYIDGNYFSIEKERIKEGEVTLKLLPSYYFLGLFGIGKECCTNTNFKATPELIERLKSLNLIKLT